MIYTEFNNKDMTYKKGELLVSIDGPANQPVTQLDTDRAGDEKEMTSKNLESEEESENR